MKKLLFFIGCFLAFPSFCLTINDTSRSSIVMDIDSSRVLYEKNADEKRLIASITKIMTAVLAIENGQLDEMVEVGEEVLSMYGSNIYLELGEKMSLKNLLYGLMLRSGNDAAMVIACHIAGSEEKFVAMMNQKASEIGMKNTIYHNSHGLDEETQNYSTARDMAILSSYANQKDIYREISGTKKWIVQSDEKSYVWNNRNKLLFTYPYATGGKTGYTPSAGRTLVTTASKENLNLTVVTLNDSSEYITHESLYEYSFNHYQNYLIVDAKKFSLDETFFHDNLYIKESFTYPLAQNEIDNVKIIAKLEKKENYVNHEEVGRIAVIKDSAEIFSAPVYVKKLSTTKGFFEKVKAFFKKLWN